jgi:hypothetical protein
MPDAVESPVRLEFSGGASTTACEMQGVAQVVRCAVGEAGEMV